MSTPQRPLWSYALRGLFLTVSVGMHGLAFAGFLPHAPDQNAPIEGLELSLAPPQGEATVEEKAAVDSSAQTETVASIPQVTQPPPPPQVQDDIEAARVEDKEAEVMEAAQKPPEPTPPPMDPPPPEEKPVVPVEKVEPAPPAQAVAAAEETFARQNVGVENGLRTGGGVTRAAYAAAVKKEIAKNRRRPAGSGRGTVNISFLIGPNGKVESVQVVKAVAPLLDDTARNIVAAIHLPPPPGGTFSGTISIKFE